jgi:hypothetical protein
VDLFAGIGYFVLPYLGKGHDSWNIQLLRHQNKMSPKKTTCKGALLQVFIRVYRLEIQSVMLYFDPPL